MSPTRRDFLVTSTAALATVALGAPAPAHSQHAPAMYGLIGKMLAAPGQRDALITVLVEGVSGMPGCLSYVVARDQGDENALWVTEVWESKESHAASLQLPSVRAAIAKGRPLIAGFGERFETTPVGGHGLVPSVAR